MSDHNTDGKSWAIVIAAVITAIVGPIVVWYVTNQQAQTKEQTFLATVTAPQTQVVSKPIDTKPFLATNTAVLPSPTPTRASQLPPSFYFEKGTANYQSGRYYDAIIDFTTCVQLYPTFADCYNGLGMAYREVGDFQQSLPNHNKAIELNPRYDFYFERGVTYHQLRSEYDKAIQDFKTCIEKNASFCNCYVRLGMAYRDKGDFTTALPYHNKAIELCPTRADFYWERGVTYQRMGNASLADIDFQKARQLGYGQ